MEESEIHNGRGLLVRVRHLLKMVLTESYLNTGKDLSAIFELSKRYTSKTLIPNCHKQRSFFKQ